MAELLPYPLLAEEEEFPKPYPIQDVPADRPVLPQDIVDARALRIHYSLGEDSPGLEFVRDAVRQGTEDRLRENIATREGLRYLQAKESLLNQIALAQGGRLTDKQVEVVRSLAATELQGDIGSILEKKFAERYIEDVAAASPEFADITPKKAAQLDTATNLVQINEYLRRKYEELDAKERERSGWSTVGDILGYFVPFLPTYRQSQAFLNRPRQWSPLHGSVKTANVDYWFLRALTNFPEAKKELDDAVDRLAQSNLLQAKELVSSLIAYSADEKFLDNVFSGVDFTIVGSPIASLWRRIRSARKPTQPPPSAQPQPPASPQAAPPPAAPPSGPRPSAQALSFWDEGAPPTVPAAPGETPVARAATQAPPSPEALRFWGEPPPPGPARAEPGAAPPGSPQALRFREETPPRAEAGVPPPGSPQALRFWETPPSPETPPAAGAAAKAVKPEAPPTPSASATPPTKQPPSAKALSFWEEAVPGELDESAKTLKNAVSALSSPRPDPVTVMANAGRFESSAMAGALEHLWAGVTGRFVNQLSKLYPTFLQPQIHINGASVLSGTQARATASWLAGMLGKLQGSVDSALRVARLTESEIREGYAAAKQYLAHWYHGKVRFVDWQEIRAENHPSRVHTLRALGTQPDGTPFQTKAAAESYRNLMGWGSEEMTAVEKGGRWYLQTERILDETDDAVRSVPIESKSNVSFWNQLLGRIRSTEDILSPQQSGARWTATHAPKGVHKAIAEIGAELRKLLSKQERKEVEAVIAIGRDMPSLQRPDIPGRWFTPSEFEKTFFDRFYKLPTPAQVQMYEAYRLMHDWEYLQRVTMLYRDMARQGVEHYRIHVTEGGQRVSSDWFAGSPTNRIPWSGVKGEPDQGIYVYDANTQTSWFFWRDSTPEPMRRHIDQMLENGFRAVKVFSAREKPLAAIAKNTNGDPLNAEINFVVTNAVERKPLDITKILPYRPGGHQIYPYNWYVSQAKIATDDVGKQAYFGDVNFFNFYSQAEAKKYAELLDQARVLMKQGQTQQLNTLLNTKLAGIPFHEMVAKNRLSLDVPIVAREANKRSVDSETSLKSLFEVDRTRNPHDPANWILDKSFLAERDAIINTIDELPNGTFQVVAARRMDPFAALEDALTQVIKNTWLTEYRIQAAENFLKEFGDTMHTDLEVLRRYPMHFFMRPQWNENMTDRTRLAVAKQAHRSIMNFVGLRTDLEKDTAFIKAKLLNSIYGVSGQKGLKTLERFGQMFDDLGLATAGDPVAFLRGSVFHYKIGFFNPVHLFLQLQTVAHTMALAPKHAFPGLAGAILAQLGLRNPDMLPVLAKKAAMFGWTEAEFKDMFKHLTSSSLPAVSHEVAIRDSLESVKLFKHGVTSFLDKGTVFFNTAERFTRIAGFTTAYREYIKQHVGKTLTEADIANIGRRADDLTVNMTRKSLASWQHGIASLATQFWTFNLRLAEQLLGHRLSTAERLRLFATYSALYGIPVGLGIPTLGVSVLGPAGIPTTYQDIRSEAYKRGWDFSSPVYHALSEGLLSLMITGITGKNYNIEKRYGPADSQLRDMLYGDRTFLEIVAGASGSVLQNTLTAMYPFVANAASVFVETEDYPMKMSDWTTVLREISSFDVAYRVYGILAYKKWLSKKGHEIADAEPIDAVMALLGLTPQNIDDVFLKQDIMVQQKRAQKKFEKMAIDNFLLGMQAARNGDYAAKEDYDRRARTAMRLGDFSYSDQLRIMSIALKRSSNLEQTIDWDFVHAAPASQMEGRRKLLLTPKQ